MTKRMIGLGAVAVIAASAGCDDPSAPATRTAVKPAHTASSGTQSTLLGRASFGDPSEETFKVKRISGDWHVEVKAKSTLDLAVCSSRVARVGGTPIRVQCSSRWLAA